MIGDLIVGYWKQKKAKDRFLGDTGGLTACRRGKERLMVQAAMLWGRRRTKKRAAGSMNGGY